MYAGIVIGWIVLSILAGVGARNKGRSFVGYFFLSLLLSPVIGLIAMAVAKPVEKEILMEKQEEKSFYSKVAGVTKNNKNGTSRQELLKKCQTKDRLQLIRDPENPYDKNAIKVCLATGEQIGFLRRELAEELAPKLDSGKKIEAFVSEVTGGEEDKFTLGCNIKIIELE